MDAATSQGPSVATRSWKRQDGVFSRSFRGVRPCSHLDLDLCLQNSERINSWCFQHPLHPVCGNFVPRTHTRVCLQPVTSMGQWSSVRRGSPGSQGDTPLGAVLLKARGAGGSVGPSRYCLRGLSRSVGVLPQGRPPAKKCRDWSWGWARLHWVLRVDGGATAFLTVRSLPASLALAPPFHPVSQSGWTPCPPTCRALL